MTDCSNISCRCHYALSIVIWDRSIISFKDATSPLLVLCLEEWHIVPERQYNSLCDDFLDTVFNLAKNDCVGDLSRTNDRLDIHFHIWHALEGDPDSVARRWFNFEQHMTFSSLEHS